MPSCDSVAACGTPGDAVSSSRHFVPTIGLSAMASGASRGSVVSGERPQFPADRRCLWRYCLSDWNTAKPSSIGTAAFRLFAS